MARPGRLRSRIRPSRLWGEAAAGLMARPGRSFLTALGTVLAVGSFVAVLGLTATANGQIQSQFDSQASTQVSVQLSQSGEWGAGGPMFPAGADSDAMKIHGVTAAGVSWDVGDLTPTGTITATTVPPGLAAAPTAGFTVLAATPGLWAVSKPQLTSGRVFDDALADAPVAVLGSDVASRLGVTATATATGQQNVIYLNDIKFLVIGVFSHSTGLSAPTTSITIPAEVAEEYFPPPATSATMTVQTRLGAAGVVASQLGAAIDPRYPDNYSALPPPGSRALQEQISGSVQQLIDVLAALFVLVGAASIANSSLTALLGRVSEIALKRSLGALPRHIGLQFVIEFTLIGGFGGLIGALLGTLAVIVTALLGHWTAIIPPWTLAAAPFLGALIGLLASLYSAIRATRIEPVEAFRR